MPVFAIVLDDSFLFKKAAFKGKDTIFERDNIEKYNKFKEYVKTIIVKFVSNIDQIVSSIHSELNNLMLNNEYKLTGWIRGCNVSNTLQPPVFDNTSLQILDFFEP